MDDVCPDHGIASAGDVVVDVACGRYTMTELVTEGGSPESWLRYRPEEPGCVTVVGGDTPSDQSHYVLEGFVFDGAGGIGVSIRSDNVGIEASQIVGPLDVVKGVPGCQEDAISGTGVSFNGHANAWVERTEIHGFQSGAITFRGDRLRLSCNYLHNNFNGVSPTGAEVYVEGNVMWMHPNHVILVEDNDDDVATHSVTIAHNLIVDTQEAVFLYGGARYEFRNNTWWGEVQDCGVGLGIQILDRTASGNVAPQGPIDIVANFQGGGPFSRYARFEVPLQEVIGTMDHNYGHRVDDDEEWAKDSVTEETWTLPQWRAAFGFGANSVNSPQAPGFADAKIHPVPDSYEEAWERFRPAPGSPLCGAGPGGADIGAVPCE